MKDYLAEAFANRDKTNAAQSSIEKTVATQQQQKVGGDPVATQAKTDAQYANPNKVSTDSSIAAFQTNKTLKNFYGIHGGEADQIEQNVVIPTTGGVRELIKESIPLSYDQQSQLKQDRELIDYGVKTAGSAAGIDVNYAISIQAVSTLLKTIQNSGAYSRITKYEKGLSIVQQTEQVESSINQLLGSGVNANDPRIQELAYQYKILVGEMIQEDVNNDIGEPLRQAYQSYTEGLSKVIYAKESDGMTLQTEYDSMIKDARVDTIRSVYYDLDTKKDRGHYDTGSRNAKSELMNNPIWLEEVSLMMRNSPAMAEIMARESEKEYISEFERDIIKEMNNKIGPQMRTAYDNAVEVLGQDEANLQFKSVKDLFSIYDRISHKTVENDLIENAYAPMSSFKVMDEMNDVGSAYEFLVAEKVAKLEMGQRAQSEAFEKVHGDEDWYEETTDSALVKATGGRTERVERFASKTKT